ncbi:hypothetical protein [Streptomyces nigrescens]|uniref:hypothetical protein n=1 Tax=Streptomyces nigrescens TaxID=1920 RepID=UPI0036A1BB08
MFLSTPPTAHHTVTVDVVESEAVDAWNRRDATKRLGAGLTPRVIETAPDGSPIVTARVLGQHAEEAMVAFVNGLGVVIADVKPQMDYSEDGVVACSWRRDGVWVRLWATDTATAPALTPLVMPARVAHLPSDRLPYRRNTTACGTSRDYTEEN